MSEWTKCMQCGSCFTSKGTNAVCPACRGDNSIPDASLAADLERAAAFMERLANYDRLEAFAFPAGSSDRLHYLDCEATDKDLAARLRAHREKLRGTT